MTSPRLRYRRLMHALDNHGAVGVLKRVLRRSPQAIQPARASVPEIHPFDLAQAVDTSGHIHGEALATGGASDLYNTAYWAISPSTMNQAFAALPEEIVPTQFTFVDLGCGKGRALLLAAQYGFSKVLGVELSPELAAVARANTGTHANVEVRAQDAVTVEYPRGPLVIFFYHPFLAPVLLRVLKGLLAQQAAAPRPLYLLFANPSYDRLIARFPLALVWSYAFTLSEEDAAADRHGITEERYVLYRAR
jgi:SAM-dependent methyltransferase